MAMIDTTEKQRDPVPCMLYASLQSYFFPKGDVLSPWAYLEMAANGKLGYAFFHKHGCCIIDSPIKYVHQYKIHSTYQR